MDGHVTSVGASSASRALLDGKRMCDECRKDVALYQCPRCRFRSCSLACCRAHKDRTQCNGKRDRTAYVREMTDELLQSDYHFLEEVLGTVDSSKRLLRHVGATAGNPAPPRRVKSPRVGDQDGEGREAPLPPPPSHALLEVSTGNGQASTLASSPPPPPPPAGGKWKSFQVRAATRGINVLFMPTGMERHKRNRSHVKHGTLHWTVEWTVHTVDPNSNEDPKPATETFTISSLSEKESLRAALSKRMKEDPQWQRAVGCTASQSLSSFRLLVRRRPCPVGQRPFVELSDSATLSSALTGTTVVEFPTIHVVHEKRLSEFPCVIAECSSDGASAEETPVTADASLQSS